MLHFCYTVLRKKGLIGNIKFSDVLGLGPFLWFKKISDVLGFGLFCARGYSQYIFYNL